MKHPMRLPHSRWLLPLCVSLMLLGACKDEDPCDPDQDSIGTGCFAKQTGGTGGSDSVPEPTAGATSEAGSSSEGNPDAMFGTFCESNADCGGPAPICATDPLFYCSQIDCQEGEANEGACPADWTCFKYLDNPSACVNL